MAAAPDPYVNPDDDNALIRRLKIAYSSTALAAVRPSLWSAAIGTATAGAAALLALMRASVPPVAAVSCAGGAIGYAYAYSCFAGDAASSAPSFSSTSSTTATATARSPLLPAPGGTEGAGPAPPAPPLSVAERERARARRNEGFMAGIGTSALVASGQLAAFRGSGANPVLLNVLMLSSASAIYYAGLGFSESASGAGPLR